MKGFEHLAQFPFGGVYYRVSNPPREDWERDYTQAAKDGMNTFRHWFLWSAIEKAPGEFDWEPYDRQLELGVKNGIKAVIADITHSAPQWAFSRLSHAMYRDQNGNPFQPVMMESTGTGGYYGLCLDNREALELAGRWLTELAKHYRGNPGLGAYDIYNESNLFSCQPEYCYCSATKQRFRDWLKAKYGDVKTLSDVWRRYGYTEWDQVDPPVLAGPYPDFMDWVRFRADNMYRLIQWRIDTIRAADPDAVIAGHVTDDCSLYRYVDACDDAWRSSDPLEIVGYTGGNGNSPDAWKWQRWLHADLTRSGARGKPFWACELTAGPNYKSLSGLPREVRIPSPEQVRYAEMTSMAAGSVGILNCRWRPLQNGPLFGSFGYYDTDGLPTDRSRAASVVAKWANAPERKEVIEARPAQGQIGILFEPETETYLTLLYGTNAYHTNMMGPNNYRYDPARLKPLQDYATGIDSTYYANSVRGAYQAMMDINIQADFVKADGLSRFQVVYMPCPLMLPEKTVKALCDYVREGGILVSEGAPAYFDETGYVSDTQPVPALRELFGARQAYVEFFPDLLEKDVEPISLGGATGAACGLFLQKYGLDGGRQSGEFTRLGGIGAVEHEYGKGKTLLIGTSLGMGFWHHKTLGTRSFFEWLLKWCGVERRATTNSVDIQARLHRGEGKDFLWIVNNATRPSPARVGVSPALGKIACVRTHTDHDVRPDGNTLFVELNALDVCVVELRMGNG